MANDFYSHGGYPATGSLGASATARAEFDAIMAGFDKMPVLAGNGLKLVRVNAGATGLESTSLIDGVTIGSVTPAAGTFTTLTATGNFSVQGNTTLGNAGTDAVTTNGNVTMNAPTSGVTVTITNSSSGSALTVVSAAGSHRIQDSTNANYEWGWQNTGGTYRAVDYTRGGGTVVFSMNNAGNVTINAPTSGATLSVVGVASTNAFIVAASGGAQFAVGTYATGIDIGTATNHTFQLLTNATARLVIAAAGNITGNAPSSGATFIGNTGAGGNAFRAEAPSGNLAGYDLYLAGTRFGTIWGNTSGFNIEAVGATTPLSFSTNGAGRGSISATGAWTLNAPSSGVTLTVNQTAASNRAGISLEGTTTGAHYYKINNTGGNYFIGAESSAGGALIAGAPAYALAFVTESARAMCFATNNTLALTLGSGGYALFAKGASTSVNSISFSATPTVDAALSNVHEIGTLTGNITTLTISNPTAGQTISIRVKQDATGSRTVATPSGAKITGSVSPTANAASILTLTYSSADTRWEGAWTQLPA